MFISQLLVYIGLFLFGVVYASIIHWMRSNEVAEGITSLQVIIGVAVTIAGCWIIEQITGDVTALQMLAAFACSGLPMTIESIGDYLLRRRNGKKLIWDKLEDD